VLASDAVIVTAAALMRARRPIGKCMEANQLRRQLKDLSDRITALRGFL
jgi:hypothetical protein